MDFLKNELEGIEQGGFGERRETQAEMTTWGVALFADPDTVLGTRVQFGRGQRRMLDRRAGAETQGSA